MAPEHDLSVDPMAPPATFIHKLESPDLVISIDVTIHGCPDHQKQPQGRICGSGCCCPDSWGAPIKKLQQGAHDTGKFIIVCPECNKGIAFLDLVKRPVSNPARPEVAMGSESHVEDASDARRPSCRRPGGQHTPIKKFPQGPRDNGEFTWVCSECCEEF